MEGDRWVKDSYSYHDGLRGMEYRSHIASPGKVFLTLGNLEMNHEQALVVIAALKACGVIKA